MASQVPARRSRLHAQFVSVFAARKSGRPAPPRSTRSAEARLGLVFPRSYVQFVSAHGGAWTPTILDTIVERHLEHPDLHEVLTPAKAAEATCLMWRGGMPKELVMFAGDCMGNAFCFAKATSARDEAEVMFFDHDFEDVRPIAKGFDALLSWYLEHCDGRTTR